MSTEKIPSINGPISQKQILDLSEQQVNLEFLKRTNVGEELIKAFLKHPEINVSYKDKTKSKDWLDKNIFIAMKQKYHGNYSITHTTFIFERFWSRLFLLFMGYKLDNKEYRVLKLLVEHKSYKENMRYIFKESTKREARQKMKKAKTKHSKIYNSFLDRGFTLKSLINDDKLIDCFIEDKTILPFIHWGNLNINKKIIKEGIRKLRNILNKKSFPVWLLLLIIISVLFIIKKRIP
tara:strand:- start:538 stop:1245 length:708 start_codon:yes stop_codon:yes gene_type:complete